MRILNGRGCWGAPVTIGSYRFAVRSRSRAPHRARPPHPPLIHLLENVWGSRPVDSISDKFDALAKGATKLVYSLHGYKLPDNGRARGDTFSMYTCIYAPLVMCRYVSMNEMKDRVGPEYRSTTRSDASSCRVQNPGLLRVFQPFVSSQLTWYSSSIFRGFFVFCCCVSQRIENAQVSSLGSIFLFLLSSFFQIVSHASSTTTPWGFRAFTLSPFIFTWYSSSYYQDTTLPAPFHVDNCTL